MEEKIKSNDLEKWIEKGKQFRAKYLLIFFDGNYCLPQYALDEKAKTRMINSKAFGILEKTIEL